MKKFNILICVLLMLFTLIACSGTGKIIEKTTTTVPATVSTTLPPSTTEAVTESTTATTTEATTTVATTSVTTTQVTTIYTTTKEVTTKPTTTYTTTEATTTMPTTTKPTTTAITTTVTTTEVTTEQTSEATTQVKDFCTVRIECNTIYDNLSKLKSGKVNFLPTSGVIIDNVKVELNGGESAFDVIKKACEENVCTDKCKYCQASGVQIEYTYTPAFNNYYIEGIHQIYEKDCGTQSGWMYSVNGAFPDVGTSSYMVSPGDVIVFSFTCNMGEDIGNIY